MTVLHNDAEMRQVARLAEMYHEQKMKQKMEKTQQQQQQQQQASTTVAAPESSASTSAATESKASRGRRKQRKNAKGEATKAEQQASPPPPPEHVPTPVQTNQPLFFDIEDPILKVRFKNQLKRHNKLLESHKEMARVQKEVVALQELDVGKRLMTRIYDQVNTQYSDSLFGKTHNMQLNRLSVIDRRAIKLETAESAAGKGQGRDRMSLSLEDMAGSPAMQGEEWSIEDSSLGQQQHPFEFDDEHEFGEEGDLFSDHARMMQEMDDYDYAEERRTLTSVKQVLKQHTNLHAESDVDDEHSEVHKGRDRRTKALKAAVEAAIEAAVERHMRLRGKNKSTSPLEKIRRKRALLRQLRKMGDKKE